MNTNITKTWTITISEDEIFSRCTNESLYQAYNRADANPKGDAMVMQEDDRGLFNMYFAAAIANLQMLLARRMEGYPEHGEYGVVFTLQMHDNHDDNIMSVLTVHCYEYVKRQILEQWYRVDLGSEIEKLEINHCLHYRKHPVRRRVSPL